MATNAAPRFRAAFWTHLRTLPLLVLVTCLLISFLVSQAARRTQEREAQARFEFRFEETLNNIRDRLLGYEQVLLGTAGLYAASESVERREFRNYVASLHLERRYPGIQGVGFARMVKPAEKSAHVAEIRRQGFPDYTIGPPGERPFYTSIIYLEPFNWRNQRAFGFDMYSEPVRRAAMARARDLGTTAISGKVTLVQETDRDVQAGFLMYVPVYRNGASLGDVEERRANLLGWTYAPFRMNDLMGGILGTRSGEWAGQLFELEIYDGDDSSPANALYTSATRLGCLRGAAHKLRMSRGLDVGGRQWTVAICSLPQFDALMVSHEARLILAAGIMVSVLLALIVYLLGSGRERALSIATRMTRSMRVLSNCNMALVHARSEQALLDEICRLLVQTGGYRLAWVGYAEDDPDKTIRPVARAGLDDGYVDAVRTTWAPSELGQGPTGTAVRLGRVIVNNDFLTGPAMGPWRAAAEARGYRSSIALPFTAAEGVRGALTIYSPVTDAFSLKEVELLEELANDLAYGIETLRVRTRREAAEAELQFLAHHDPLTRLPNRVLLGELFDQAAAAAAGKPQGLAFLFLDLDNFKQVNDSFGHQLGDTLLVHVVERLRLWVQDSDTISRQGGDEFVILAPGIGDASDAERLSRKILDGFGEPFEIDGYLIQISLSIGISIFERDGTDFHTLLKKADAALYHAKEAGRNTYLFFNEKMGTDAREEIQLRGELRNALKNGEFVLHYQPQMSIREGRVIGAEALVRWNHPTLGTISPARFIPIAERCGLVIPLGEWVLREACRQMRAWNDAGLPPLTVAVNLSAVQLKSGNILATVADALHASGLPPRQLELELTESMLLHDIDATVAALHAWNEMGIQLSIDDFGTGYSSLSYLTRFAVNKLKVDQSFVRGLGKNPDDAAVVMAIIQLGHTLGLSVIAEGVEDATQLSFLARNRCDEAQGYLFSRPLPAREFEEFVVAHAAEKTVAHHQTRRG